MCEYSPAVVRGEITWAIYSCPDLHKTRYVSNYSVSSAVRHHGGGEFVGTTLATWCLSDAYVTMESREATEFT